MRIMNIRSWPLLKIAILGFIFIPFPLIAFIVLLMLR